MMDTRQVVVLGEVLFDVFGGAEFSGEGAGRRRIGGAPFNVAWHLHGFGCDPLLLTAVGLDPAGDEVLQKMKRWGMRTEGVQQVGNRPTGEVRVMDAATGPRYEIPPGQAWDQIRLVPGQDPAGEGQERLVYHGTLALRSAVNRRSLGRLLRVPGTRAYADLNLREPWSTRQRIRSTLTGATWVKLNHQELAWIASVDAGDATELHAAAFRLAEEYQLERLVVTQGAEGAFEVLDGVQLKASSGGEVEDFVDSVGAGDAFTSVHILGILNGWTADVTLDRANRFAADVCSMEGAVAEDRALYRRHQERWKAQAWPSRTRTGPQGDGIYVVSLSVHGLIRGTDPELGRDADTGGQIGYVLDQARALARHPGVQQVDLVTRLVEDRKVDDAYAVPEEPLGEGARIVRIPFGPRRYLRKESLWKHLDGLVDGIIRHLGRVGQAPDVILAHYADAGYVGAQLARLLGVPLLFTGHSLGRVKRARLLADGGDAEVLDRRYRLPARIEAEEVAQETADLVIASTGQEIEEQYADYENHHPESMLVIPPGVALERFSAPGDTNNEPRVGELLGPFLRDPERPLILAIARADERKNLPALVEAFAGSPELREGANLAIVAGVRDALQDLPSGSQRVIRTLLELIDDHDLHGRVALPKRHESDDIPQFYRAAARSRGVFVNAALTEPFGLTLLEAAASGLPVVATNDGGPRDILQTLRNGVLVDPLDPGDIARGIREVLDDPDQWAAYARAGLDGVHESYAWERHAGRLVEAVRGLGMGAREKEIRRPLEVHRLLVVSLDVLTQHRGKDAAALTERLRRTGPESGFLVSSWHDLDHSLRDLEGLDLPAPAVLITGSGTAIHYGPDWVLDRSWDRQVRRRWLPKRIREVLEGQDEITLEREWPLRLLFRFEAESPVNSRHVHRVLRRAGLRVTLIPHGDRFEILPVTASPGTALRFLCFKWNLPLEQVLVAAAEGRDADLLTGRTRGVVVRGPHDDLRVLDGSPDVFFSTQGGIRGVLEGLDHYRFPVSEPARLDWAPRSGQAMPGPDGPPDDGPSD